MTNKEAIKKLKSVQAEFNENWVDYGGINQAFEKAYKALERPQGEFTDLEREVIADAINYLLGAELLEENGYTEEIINALKSALQKLGAEENHL